MKTLRARGVENPELLLKGAKYLVTPWPHDKIHDVVVRLLCKKGQAPAIFLRHAIAEAVRDNADAIVGDGTIHSVHFFRYDTADRYVRLGTDTPRPHPLGLNQCRRIPNRWPLIERDGLRFRSRGEVAIYEELTRRDVLFFPCAAAVLGQSAVEYGDLRIEQLEPDFLVCLKGKWGILEINGDEFHSGPVSQAKDHDRARKFKHYGLLSVEAFTADECKADPAEVVDKFLVVLGKQK